MRRSRGYWVVSMIVGSLGETALQEVAAAPSSNPIWTQDGLAFDSRAPSSCISATRDDLRPCEAFTPWCSAETPARSWRRRPMSSRRAWR